eukprot:110897-Pelagomonas_calceolata.AAC.1
MTQPDSGPLHYCKDGQTKAGALLLSAPALQDWLMTATREDNEDSEIQAYVPRCHENGDKPNIVAADTPHVLLTSST